MGLVEDITLRDAAGRLARCLLDMDTTGGNVVHLPVMKKDLASRLNLTSETLSRTLRRLTDAGILTSDGAALTLLDRDQLTLISDGLGPEL